MTIHTHDIIGAVTVYDGTDHPYLTGCRVRVVAVFKNGDYITDNDALEVAGGIEAGDRVEVQPWLPDAGRYSFVTSDPRAIDLRCFADLQKDKP